MSNDSQTQLSALQESHRRLQRLTASLGICFALVLLLGATTATMFDGDVKITGDLVVDGKVNGVDVQVGEIHLGMMIPYFGDKLPKGFCWADGETPWPIADWVPEKLHGRNVPNMNGELLGGAESVADLGEPWNKGVIKLTVSNATSGEILFWKRGEIIPKHLQTDDADAQIDSIARLGYVSGVTFEGGNSTYPFSNANQNPRYIQCRWIIRVE